MATVVSTTAHPILLFDGDCRLCQRSVQFAIKRDSTAQVRFAALQSAVGQELLQQYDLPTDWRDSIVLIEGERASTHSSAALRLCRRLRFPWSLAFAGMICPRWLRDWVYKWIAGNRFRWFGRTQQCMLMTPELRERFLDL